MKMAKSAAVQLKYHIHKTIQYIVIVVAQTWTQHYSLVYLGIRF